MGIARAAVAKTFKIADLGERAAAARGVEIGRFAYNVEAASGLRVSAD